jgi:16S rRNA (cytosine967-C5)-methyltransferase
VTCSIFPTEGEEQALWFGAQLPDAIRLQAPGQLLPGVKAPEPAGGTLAGQASLPSDHDGFYYARFQKRA